LLLDLGRDPSDLVHHAFALVGLNDLQGRLIPFVSAPLNRLLQLRKFFRLEVPQGLEPWPLAGGGRHQFPDASDLLVGDLQGGLIGFEISIISSEQVAPLSRLGVRQERQGFLKLIA